MRALVAVAVLLAVLSCAPKSAVPAATPAPQLRSVVDVKAYTTDRIAMTVKLLVTSSSTSTPIDETVKAEVLQGAIARLSALTADEAVQIAEFPFPTEEIVVLMMGSVTPPPGLELAWLADFNARLISERTRQDIELIEPLLTPAYVDYVRAQNVRTQILSSSAPSATPGR